MWNASQALETGAFRSDEIKAGMFDGGRCGMHCGGFPEQEPEDDVCSAVRSGDSGAGLTDSAAVLDPLDELRILESSVADSDRRASAPASCATPAIAGVEHLERPMVMGELDAPLANQEQVRVFDALTGEDLGAAVVNSRWWTLEDPRVLTQGQAVVYVARLIDAAGEASDLSNACEFVFEASAAGARATRTEHSRGAAGSQALPVGESGAVALITQVTVESRQRVVAVMRKRPGDAKLIRCRHIISGTLSEALRTGETLHVFDGSIDLGCALVRGTTWMFCDERILRATYALNYTALIVDRDGNLGSSSSIYMMTAGEAGD
jgi:hypothetical protein